MINIMLVDDNKTRVKSIKKFCHTKYEIIQTFEYSDDARQWIKRQWERVSAEDRPDVLVIDLKLKPNKDGNEHKNCSRKVLFAMLARQIPLFPAILISENYNNDWLDDLEAAINRASVVRRNQSVSVGADLLYDWFQAVTAHSKAANDAPLAQHIPDRIIALSEHYGLEESKALIAVQSAQGQVSARLLEPLAAELLEVIKASEAFKKLNAKFKLT